MIAGYTVWVNLLDYTASVIPVTTVDKTVDVWDASFTPVTEMDKMVFENCTPSKPLAHLSKLTNPDDPEIYDGAHVSVQLVGRKLQEEKILVMTEIIGDALGKHVV